VAVFFVGANNFKVQFLLVSGKQDLYAKIHITAALIGYRSFLYSYDNSLTWSGISHGSHGSWCIILTSLIVEKLAKRISRNR